jgi:hypothetical protein
MTKQLKQNHFQRKYVHQTFIFHTLWSLKTEAIYPIDFHTTGIKLWFIKNALLKEENWI